VSLVLAAGLAVGGCGSSGSTSAPLVCPPSAPAAGTSAGAAASGAAGSTVYVATVPVNPLVGVYLGGGKGTLFALNARTGVPEWSWDEVQNLWGNPGINSGGGQ
jgi:hypothetical protein